MTPASTPSSTIPVRRTMTECDHGGDRDLDVQELQRARDAML